MPYSAPPRQPLRSDLRFSCFAVHWGAAEEVELGLENYRLKGFSRSVMGGRCLSPRYRRLLGAGESCASCLVDFSYEGVKEAPNRLYQRS